MSWQVVRGDLTTLSLDHHEAAFIQGFERYAAQTIAFLD
jgi:hypothetical protein